jgi:glycerol-3-phosphate dehydrogenase
MRVQDMYDVIIIGAGVSGCAIARELSRYEGNFCVLEKSEDVCCGTSKANSGIVHAGHDAKPGSMMAKMNVRGNFLMESLLKELDFPFKRNGSMVLCLEEDKKDKLTALYEQGIVNGVPGLQLLDGKKARELEPNISPDTVAAIYAPSGGIVCPFGLNIALAENACTNGVKFYFHTEVRELDREQDGWSVKTNNGEFQSRFVVNAAGVYADVLHNMVSEEKIHIVQRRGDYMLMDHAVGDYVSHTIFQLPDEKGKGVLVTPTTHGNLMVGPTAIDVEDKEGNQTTQEGLDQIREKAGRMVVNPPLWEVITSFAGLRAHEDGYEFIIGEVKDAPGFVDCAGIESPGLTSAPAIGEYVAGLLQEHFKWKKNPEFTGTRKGILNPGDLSPEERNQLIKENPSYGTIICRCENVTEGEIIDAINRPLGARTLDGIKRRTRAGMGRCQSGFCSPKTMEIMARELEISQTEICKSGPESFILKK